MTDVITGLPILDIDRFDGHGPAEREAFLADLRDTCHRVGFFYAVGHRVDPAVSGRVLELSRRFFALPLDERLAIDHRRSPQFRGYTRLGDERTNGERDQREQIDVGADREPLDLGPADPPYLRLDGPNLWPPALPELREAVQPWLAAMEQLGHRIVRAIAASLGQPEDLFDATFGDRPNLHAKIIRYPGRDEAESDQGVGAHKDYGYLALLLLEPGSAGLQVVGPGGDWIDVEPLDGAIVVNLGEMLEVATRGYLKATRHRVVSPPAGQDRISVPFFFNPRLDAVVEPLPLPPELEAEAAGADDDPDNPLFGEFGRNAIKGWLRAHPEVAERHHPDLL